ncbi:MAG: 3-isopropylmalate dehydratase small subunit, partial [Bacteroidales bacterium]|nr:3-isopropylmalate dehydratase small subunit [Bacteroidales bacterium]
AGFPILTYDKIEELDLEEGDQVMVNFQTGKIVNQTKEKDTMIHPFSQVQMDIYLRGGLFK